MFSRSVQLAIPQCSFAAARPYIRGQVHSYLADSLPRQSLTRRLASDHLQKRHQSTQVNSQNTDTSPVTKSIFSPDVSAWDHVFHGIDEMPPLASPSSAHLRPKTTLSPKRPRNQAMTAQEIVAFDQMFDMIFNAIQKDTYDDPKTKAAASVGVLGKDKVDELYGNLRRSSKKVKWTSEEEEALDKKKEEINLCDTDQQLLEWAMREVFSESQRYTEEAQKQMLALSQESSPTLELPTLQPPTYPHIVAILMRTFRDKYRDPHLALSIFDHSKNLSIPSYVFGCSTLSYNELIQTRWECFRDLKGVYEALEEMSVNGVEADRDTLRLLDAVRRDVGENHSWVDECEFGTSEAWKLVAKIDAFIAKRSSKSAPASHQSRSPQSTWQKPRLDEWKGSEHEDDSWQFDDWDLPRWPVDTQA